MCEIYQFQNANNDNNWGMGGDFGFRNWILNFLIHLNTIVPDSTSTNKK